MWITCPIPKSRREKLTTKVQWVSLKQQFFNSTIISPEGLNDVKVSVEETAQTGHIKTLGTSFSVPYGYQPKESHKLTFFFGPNHYNTLSKLGIQLEKTVPLGWGIFGWVNRFIVIPIFNWLGQYISSFGIIILLRYADYQNRFVPVGLPLLYLHRQNARAETGDR